MQHALQPRRIVVRIDGLPPVRTGHLRAASEGAVTEVEIPRGRERRGRRQRFCVTRRLTGRRRLAVSRGKPNQRRVKQRKQLP